MIHGNHVDVRPSKRGGKDYGLATSILFLRKRPHFYRVDGTRAPFNSGAPICLVAYGEENDKYLAFSGLGKWVNL